MARKRRRGEAARKEHPETELTQEIADSLIGMPKVVRDPGVEFELRHGRETEIDFENESENELFRVIVQCSRKNLSHAKYELLARRSIVLLRFEIDGPPHANPNGDTIPCPHLHSYRYGYADRWATPITNEFGDTNNLPECFRGFLRHCNVLQLPPIRWVRELFS